ncbi:MAG: hypothetical protein H7X97_14335 [Opitutaceae bacterium]|nr:hypothetical protein [Verrucomicrobiales bacterium]
MRRVLQFSVCVILGLLALACGLLMPAHLRAVDVSVIERAGRRTDSLVERGLALVSDRKLGAAQLLLNAAKNEGLPGVEALGAAVTNLAARQPDLRGFGGTASGPAEALRRASPSPRESEPFTVFMIRPDNRIKAIELLGASTRPIVQELMRCRALTSTVIFPPSSSASGQAFDAAVGICGLLLEGNHLTASFGQAIFGVAGDANRGGSSQPIEQLLLDLMSLGQKFNWGQLTAFVEHIEDVETLHRLSDQIRQPGEQMPMLFAGVQLSGRPAGVANYLVNYSQSGLKDLGTSLRFGAGGVGELLERNQRLFKSDFRQQLSGQAPFRWFLDFTVNYCWRTPFFALMVKWIFYLAAGFLLAAALPFARAAVSVLEQPLQVRGFHIARKVLFALGFLLVVLLLGEPFLSQDSQKVETTFRLRLPTVGSAVPAGPDAANRTFMNQLSLLTLFLFFVLQALIYVACLVKLAEVRRQKAPVRLKLKLLDNEEHLFDAGLYLGFVGTIISLILVSLGVIKPSLMAAYSSTSFGIIFVSIFKIFHLRPLRRKLLLEAESAQSDKDASTPEATLAASL